MIKKLIFLQKLKMLFRQEMSFWLLGVMKKSFTWRKSMNGNSSSQFNISPPQMIMIIFVILIIIGSSILALPVSSANGESIGLLDALFTATSAVCVNGLAVIETGSSFSRFGQVIIM